MKTRRFIAVGAVLLACAFASDLQAQGRAVGVAIDPVESEFENARALTADAREKYDNQMKELFGRVASGEVPQSHAARLQRLLQLGVLEPQLREALAYLKLLDARELQNRTGRAEITKAIEDTKLAVSRALNQRDQLRREVNERRGPALLVALEYTKLTGERLTATADEQGTLQEFQELSNEIDVSIAEGQDSQRILERQLVGLDQDGPRLQGRRAIANQRVELIRTRTILLRSGAGTIGPLPDLPKFGPLPSLLSLSPERPADDSVLADPEALRRRLLQEGGDGAR